MLPVSSEFTTETTATIREPKARVTITWADPYIDLGIEAVAVSNNEVSYPNQVADLIELSARRWAILGQGIVADGSYYAMPGTEDEALDNQVGWIGSTSANGSGDFAVPEVLTITFPPRPVLSLLLVGDDKYNEYAVDFTVQCWIGGTLLRTDTITGNALLRWTLDVSASNMAEVDKMVLSISKWSAADHVVKITEFYSSIVVTYDGDDIMSFDLLEESEIQSASLPIGNISANEVTLSLQNIENAFFPGNRNSLLHTLMKQNRKIEPEIGFELPSTAIEYVPLGVFWSGDWVTPELGTSATTTARDRMELLRRLTFDPGGVYEDLTLADLAEVVLESGRIEMPDMEYAIDPNFGTDVVPFAYFKKTNHMTALRDIMSAGLGRAYCDRSGVIQIEAFDLTDTLLDLEITDDDYFSKTNPTNSDQIANRIEVTTQPLVPSEDVEEIYVQKEAIDIAAGATSDPLEVKYSAIPSLDPLARAYIANEDGGLNRDEDDVITSVEITIASATYYAWGAIVTVTNTSGGSGAFLVVVSGNPLTVEGSEVVTADDLDSQREFGILKYTYSDNALVQTREMAEAINAALLPSYQQPRRDASIIWRVNPALEISDIIDTKVYKDSTIDIRGRFRGFRTKLNYDGGLRGTVECRKLYEYVVSTLIQLTNDDTDPEIQGTNDDTDPEKQGITSQV